MEKHVMKLADLAQLGVEVEVAPTQFIKVRGLSLNEMVGLFVRQTESFLTLYAQGMEGKADIKDLTPFLLTCPTMVAEIIALATDEPQEVNNAMKLPGTVQLIALSEIWKLSVPDPKKAQELLSVVTALLRSLVQNSGNIKEKVLNMLQKDSPTAGVKP